MNLIKQKSQITRKKLILLPLLLLQIIFTPKLLLSRITENEIFNSVRAVNFLLGRNLTISENMSIGQNGLISGNLTVGGQTILGGTTTINGNLTVNGVINGAGAGITTQLPVNTNEIARFTDNTGAQVKGSPVTIDNSGNMAGVNTLTANTVDLQGITKSGNTVSWPSATGAVNSFLGVVSPNQLGYITPAGAGNVSTALTFVNDNRIVTTDTPSGNTYVKQTNIILDGSDNISGVNLLTANTVNANLTGSVGGQTATDVANATIAVNAATANNTASTIIKRDASGYFSATGMTGAASLNVLKAGDTMTGNLTMTYPSQVSFKDFVGLNSISLGAPLSITTPYIVNLPTNQPSSPNQFLMVTNSTTPFDTAWVPGSGSPAQTKAYYVSLYGLDTNDGSFGAPFLTVKHAVSQASGVANLANPVTIFVGPGIFAESNPINIAADGISIVGSSISSTIIKPLNFAANLFSTAKSNVTFENLSFDASSGVSSAAAFSLSSVGSGRIRFSLVAATSFKTGFDLSRSSGTSPIIILDNIQFAGSGTGTGACIVANDIALVLKNGVFRGPLFGPAANTAIKLTGSGANAYISDSTFILYSTGISVTSSSSAHVLSSILESTTNGFVCTGASKTQIIGCNFILNSASTINVNATVSGTKVYLEGCLFDCEDATPAPQGTCIKCTTGAEVIINNSTLDEAVVGIDCGQAGDLIDTQVIASGVNLRDCTTCIQKIGVSNLSTLRFTGGSFDENTMTIGAGNSTNVTVGAFDDDGALAFGNNQDVTTIPIYKVSNGQPSSPTLQYYPNFYGNKGTVYLNPNSDQTLNATVAQSNDASYYVVSGDNTKQAKVNLISDTSAIGTGDSVRGWEISKLGGVGSTNGNLAFTYSDNDPIATRGANQTMRLNGYDNCVEFPVATNAPTPTNTIAKLVWAPSTDTKTNLYRSALDTLKTDGNFVIGTGSTLTVPAGSAAAPSIIFPTSTNTGIYSTAPYNLSFTTTGVQRMNISPTGIVSINSLTPTAGVVHNDNSGALSSSLIINSDITAGTIQNDRLFSPVTSSPTGSTIVFRDINGDFSAHAITAVGGIGAGFFASGAGNGFFATSGATFVGPLTGTATNATTAVNFTGSLIGDVTGTQGSTIVTKVGGQFASDVASATILANAATNLNTSGQIVRRDGSGNFSAGTITANLFSGPLSGNATSATTAINANYADSSATFTTALTGDVTGGNSLNTTIVQSIGNGARTAAQVIAATDLALSATSANTASTIVRRDLTGNFITNMITLNTSAIINPNDATTKSYVDSQVNAGGLVPKTPVLVVSTISTNTFGFDYIDSVTVANGDRVLLIAQAAPSSDIYNGIWEARAGNWTRPSDFLDTSTAGRAYVLTTSGATQAGSSWLCSTPNAIVGTDPIQFLQFSLPGTTTGANVGSGAGQIFRDKTGITINFKTLAALTYMQINNQADTVEIGTNATPNNATGTIVARDASGYFSATGMTGAASLNVLKSGDTMTGILNMGATGARQPIRFRDNGIGGNYIGLQAPATISTSYTIDLPDTAPVAGQFLQALTSTITTWTTIDTPPASSKSYYVSLSGKDGPPNNGSFSLPYRTIKYTVSEANGVANLGNPVTVNVGPGFFVEDNSGSPIAISNPGVSIVGSSISSTIITANYYNNNLFSVTTPNVEFCDLIIRSTGVSAKSAIYLNTSTSGRARFTSVGVSTFNKAFEIINTGITPLILFDNVQCIDNATSISLDNVECAIKNSVFQGSSTATPSNTGINISGANSQIILLSSILRVFDTAVNVSDGSLRASAIDVESTINGLVFTGSGSKGFLSGINSILNLTNSVNILAQTGALVYLEGCLLECDDALGSPAGTGLKVIDGATIKASNSTISDALVAIECGQTGDFTNSYFTANSISLISTTTDIRQRGNGNIKFVGGTIENATFNFEDPTKVVLAEFESNGEATLSFGNTYDTDLKIYQIQNGQSLLPHLQYNKNFYGAKGTVYNNENIYPNPTVNATVGQTDDTSYYIITGDSTKTAKIKLISDPLPGTGNSMRGWEICKNSNTGADLLFTYTNNDSAAYGPNTIMQFDGVNNKIIFPTSTNSPIGTPKLVWAPSTDTKTNLYRSALDTLKTDANFIVGIGSVLNLPTGPAGTPALTFAGSPSSGIYSDTADNISFSTTGAQRMNISPTGIISINSLTPTAGVVHNNNSGALSSSLIGTSDIATGTITNDKLATQVTSSNTPNTIVLRNGLGNFDAGTIYANLIGTVTGNLYGTATSATNATTAINFSGTLGGDVSGLMLTTTVDKVGGVPAATIASAVTTVQEATDSPATPFTLVQRDASGGFTAGTIIATLSGHATQDLLKAGDSMLGTFTAIAGSAAVPSIQFTGSTNTGLSTPTPDTLTFSTLGAQRMGISSGGVISINNLGATGVVHNSSSGILTTTLISNTDIDPAAGIADTKLATIATTGKVANSATTATGASVANTIVLRDNSGSFTSNIITATGGFVGNLSGTASGNLSSTGGSLSGALTLPASIAPITMLNFTSNLTTGISATGNALSLMANNIERLNISSAGTITLSSLATATGIVHNTNGVLSSSLIVNSDITPLTITNASIANNTITNTQIASNTITNDRLLTQTSANTPNYIVTRDGSGNFAAGTITASLMGTVTAPAGTALSPSIQFAGSTNTGISAATANTLSFDTNGTEKMSISATGTITVNTGPLTLPASTAPTNMLNFTGDLNTGISATGSVLSLNATGANILNISSTGATITSGKTLTLPATTAPTPSLNFTGNTTTGISATGSVLSLIANNTTGINVSSALTTILTPISYNSITEPAAITGAITIPAPTTSILSLSVSGAGAYTITITMPTSPANGRLFTINMKSNTGGIHTLAYAGGTVVNAVTQLLPGTNFTATTGGASVTYIYMASTNSWYKFSRG